MPSSPVRPLIGGGYMVASRTHRGAYWLVDFDDNHRPSCTCPATVELCRHMRMVVEHCKIDDAKHARPKMPAAPASAFVE